MDEQSFTPKMDKMNQSLFKTPVSVKDIEGKLNKTTTNNKRASSLFTDVFANFSNYNPQKGIQTILFNSLAILLSVTILFLLTQIYYIFLPCLKALLWALLCGSALYPFKIRLETMLKSWLQDLNQKNRSFCFGCLLLPFQIQIHIYCWTIEFISRNKILFLLFHFRFQISDTLKFSLFPLLALHRGIIVTLILIIVTIHLLVVIYSTSSQNILNMFLSFNFIPSIIMMIMFYCSLNHFGIIGEIVFIFGLLLFLIGLTSTVYSLLYEFSENKTIHEELNNLLILIGERFRSKIESWINYLRKQFHVSPDSVDGSGMNLGKLFMSLLFTVFIFAIGEHMGLANLVLAIWSIHLILKNLFALLNDKFSSLIKFLKHCFDTSLAIVVKKFENDVLFKFVIHFFIQGDRIIKSGLQKSLDLLTSITLFMIVGMMIVVFSVFLSVKIYGECYQTIYMLQNELKNIEFIQESINMTLNKLSDMDYLNSLIIEKFNPREDEKLFLNKMLFEFRNNILPYFNHTSLPQNTSVTDNIINQFIEDNQTSSTPPPPPPPPQTLSSSLIHLSPSLFSLMDFKNFNKILNFINTQASSYLPLLKSFLSFSSAFIFVILDSSTFLLSFVLNFIIFALALFYLLSSSHEKYKPIEFLDHIVGSLVTNQDENQFSHYVEEVINSIFAATIKISAFYGVYTWLVHSLFGIRICCIPSVIAAILAAIPLLNAYWASLPACVYLYYFDPNLPLVKSLSMFLIAILPSFIVDSSIYSDIKKGGHPYLTGLAITCGVVYYGVEGALFGPLWLCLLFIILNMCTEFDSKILNQNQNLTP